MIACSHMSVETTKLHHVRNFCGFGMSMVLTDLFKGIPCSLTF